MGVNQMSYQLKKSIVSLLCSLLIIGLYCLWVFQVNPDKSETIEGTIKYWGIVMILMLPVQIIPKIIVQIIFSMINWLTTKEKEPSFSDELDKLINLKSTRNSFYGFCFIFFGSMGLLALELPISTMFYTMFFGLSACGLIAEISEFAYYRRGA